MAFCVRTFLISFFIGLLFANCRSREEVASVTILWKNHKAVGLTIPKSLLTESESPETQLRVQLVTRERSDILGIVNFADEAVIFEPVVPFTKGLQYEVMLGNVVLSTIRIPESESSATQLIGIYPSQDTVPENLLKIYLKFSHPMAEGRSLSQITLLNHRLDTMHGTFLDLQPELWNVDGTVLTLWLDPGRIKRDLIPNKTLGTPLEAGERYTLHVSTGWRSKEGVRMKEPFKKTFVTTSRDDVSPSPALWRINSPAAGTNEPLIVDVLESLDYSLLNDAIEVLDKDNVSIAGEVLSGNEERSFQFIPDEKWKANKYVLRIEGRLEDLAGNNLNRPFDRDLNTAGGSSDERKVFERKFTIR